MGEVVNSKEMVVTMEVMVVSGVLINMVLVVMVLVVMVLVVTVPVVTVLVVMVLVVVVEGEEEVAIDSSHTDIGLYETYSRHIHDFMHHTTRAKNLSMYIFYFMCNLMLAYLTIKVDPHL